MLRHITQMDYVVPKIHRKEVNKIELSLRFKKLTTTSVPPTTQKARGVWYLLRNNPFSGIFHVDPNIFLGINTTDETQGKPEWPWKTPKTLFGRPCPERPRHGFVESVRVTDEADVRKVYMKALESDPKAEILVMPFVDASYSAIFVPESGILVLGHGHDGATGGKKSITLPVCSSKISKDFRENAGIDPTQHVYAELVQTKQSGYVQTYIVQARSGPPIAVGSLSYIPKKMKVQHIIEPTEDLLAWESLTQALAGAEGVVCVHEGGSLASHAAIHCRSNGIPYLTRKVEVGDWIEPESAAPKGFDLKEFQIGVNLSHKSREIAKGLQLAIAILHNIIRLEYSDHYSRLLGFSLGYIFRAAAAACLGESRHYRSGKKTGDKAKGALGTTNRDLVYRKASDMDNSELCQKLAHFSYRFVHNTWSNGFGGWKWFTALVQAIKLWNLISAARYQDAIAEANLLLNMAHNGGWLFNKFCGQDVMSECANNPGASLAVRMDQLMELIASEQEFVPIKTRSYRSSRKWSVEVEPANPHGDTGLWVFVIQGIKWHPTAINATSRKLLKDMFDNV